MKSWKWWILLLTFCCCRITIAFKLPQSIFRTQRMMMIVLIQFSRSRGRSRSKGVRERSSFYDGWHFTTVCLKLEIILLAHTHMCVWTLTHTHSSLLPCTLIQDVLPLPLSLDHSHTHPFYLSLSSSHTRSHTYMKKPLALALKILVRVSKRVSECVWARKVEGRISVMEVGDFFAFAWKRVYEKE